MSAVPVRKVRILFERVLDYPVEQREARARELCRDDPNLCEALLVLVRKDRVLDEAAVDTDSGLGSLAREALPEAFPEGRVVGPFRVEECIGSGGMGRVYRVRRIDGEVEQEAALKLLRPYTLNSSLLSRFSNERRVLASLEHPSICRFLDAGTLPGDQPFVLMELIRGTPLLEYCDQKHLDLRDRMKLFLKVTRAIAYAHRKLVVHRDVKSSNVLVTDDGEPRLLDFGIAKNLGSPDLLTTQTSEHFLTPKTAAPEQFLGDPVGISCDLYALGLMLYELLSGMTPFDFVGMSAAQVEQTILQRPPLPMSRRCQLGTVQAAQVRGFDSIEDLRHALCGDLDAIVLKCLRKRPDERYASAEQLEGDLQRVLENRPILARRGERWYRMRKFVIRNRVPVIFASALVVTMVVSFCVVLFQAVNMAEQRSRALMERDKAQYAVNVLKNAFISADPARVAGGDTTARQILKSARTALSPLIESQPELFVSLATVLAEVELALELNDSAADIVRQGIDVGQAAGIDDVELRPLWLLKGRALTDSNHRKEAEGALAKVRGLDAKEQADWLYARGRWLAVGGRPEEAIGYLERAVDATAGDLPTESLTVAIRWQLAEAQSSMGRHDQSLANFEGILDWLHESLGIGHPLVAQTRFRRLNALIRASQLDAAWDEAVAIRDSVLGLYGADSAMAGRMHSALGILLVIKGNRAEAVTHYRQAREIWRATLGPNHPHLLRLTINLAHALEGLEGAEREAENSYREALHLAQLNPGEENRASLMVRGYLARLLARQGRSVDAMTVLLDIGPAAFASLDRPTIWEQVFTEIKQSIGCDDPRLSAEIRASCENNLYPL